MNEDLVPGLRALVPIRPFLKDRLVELPVRLQGEWEGKPQLPESGARRASGGGGEGARAGRGGMGKERKRERERRGARQLEPAREPAHLGAARTEGTSCLTPTS